MNAAPVARILIVDDEAANMHALRDTLRDRGYDAEGFTTGEAALNALRERQFDLLLTDLMMPGMDGVALLGAALKIDPQLVGILMTGKGTIETAVQAMQAGALDYVLKPIKISTLLPVLTRAVGVRRLRLENLELRNTVAIHELNQAIAYTLDPNVLLDKIADSALAQFEADEASVMLLTEDGDSLYVAAVRGDQRDALLGTRVSIGKGIAGQVAASREPLVLQGEVVDPRTAPLHPRPAIQSALSMPMITRNKLIGVLNVNYTRQPRTIPLGQIKVLSIFVNAAAAGIEAARLHEAQRKADARYREVLHMAADGIISTDDEQRILIFNAGAEKLFGYRPEEVLGKSLDVLLPVEVVGAHRHHMQVFGQGSVESRAMAARKRLFGRRKDGTLVDIEVGISKRSENGKMLYTAVVRDITQRIQQEERIARLTRLYAVLSGINSAIVRIGEKTALFSEICRIAVEIGKFRLALVFLVNEEMRELKPAAWLGVDEQYVRMMPLDLSADAAHGTGLARRAVLERKAMIAGDITTDPRAPPEIQKESLRLGIRAMCALPLVVTDKAVGVLILGSELPGTFDSEEEMDLLLELAGDFSFALDHIAKTHLVDYLATHDQLTDLPNRVLFLDRLAQAMITAQHQGSMLAVVIADIERFKHMNDAFGRQAGDALLRQIADRFRKLPGECTNLARVGSDIFAMIYSDFAHAATVTKMLREHQEGALADPFDVGGKSLHVSARAGVALFPADGTDAERLFQNAEVALKRAKTQNERSAFYTADLNARVAEQLTLENKLRQALERNEFVLHYQPKVDLVTNRIVSLEALIRWQDPDGGLVPPIQFIPLLEETGLILPVGNWVMQEATRAAASLQAKGLPPIRIAVNVSAIQLRQKDFVRSVDLAIAAGGGTPHGLDLEITESVIMEDIEANVRKLDAVRSMNVGLAIDDFGTGYSSLAYIARLPVDTIKIDRTFIMKFKNDADSMSIVQTIISLTHALQRKAVAEGVETEEQAHLLRLLRCDQYQGYLFSKPVPRADIEKLLLSEKSS
jgi:diguanylate cyclase (GGDEF)-like protein/PAS domain S-box-containing protein